MGERAARLPPTVRSSLLWGLVGGFSFLVLLQGYELATGQRVTLGAKFGVALLVALGATASTYAVGRSPRHNENP